jgi:hypothetical protein
MNKKRGYYIHGGDPKRGFAVVATSLQEARVLVYHAGEIEAEWIDITGWWCRNAIVDDLPIGVVEDLQLGLLRGMFDYLKGECDVCGGVRVLHEYNGQAICWSCDENVKKQNVND